ncbi:hypothetical protein GC093_01900 [Paenibacillus sp. LMG 31456]|uniref:Sporulation protein n=1 Tax=Paenibacillus foliorum TaxID=2654974 RepID=A0A972JX11_9BACL|nr:hypothetical protein [Paenibacillus foliorum]NOU91989.1 hypothetical protein [Paenibacillus foliorum]
MALRQLVRGRIVASMLIAFMIMVSSTACQKQNTQVKSYSQDGLLGITDVNPNMPTSPTHHTYLADTRLIKETINQVPHVTGSTISVNGDVANVKVDVPTSLSDQEVAAVEKEAREKLAHAMPRYTVKVSVSRK